jgi:predicted alpha/beta-fold hydrolase
MVASYFEISGKGLLNVCGTLEFDHAAEIPELGYNKAREYYADKHTIPT